MDHSPNRPSVSPLSKTRMQSEQTLKLQDLKYKEKLLQMDKINAKLQSQLDEALLELEKANKNLHLQNQMKETQDNEYLRLLKENELLKGDLQFKLQENELNKQKLAQQNKQYQSSLENLKEQYEQLQQSLMNKYIIEMNTKLQDQKQQYDTFSKLQTERMKENEHMEKQYQEQILDYKQSIQEIQIKVNEQKQQIETFQKQSYIDKQIIADKELQEQLLLKKVEQLQIELSRLTTDIDISKEKYLRLEKQYEQNITNIVQSKDQQAEEQTSKLYQQHEQSIQNLTLQNQDIWKQLQEQKQINQVQQKEITRLLHTNQQQGQDLIEKDKKLKDLSLNTNQSSEQCIILQQSLLQTEQALQLYKSQLDDFKQTRGDFEQRMMERSKGILRQKEQEFQQAQQMNEQKIDDLTQEIERMENEYQNQSFKQLQEKLMSESNVKSLLVKIAGIEEQNSTLLSQLEETRQELLQKSTLSENLSVQLNKEKTYNQTTLRIQKNQMSDLQQKLNEYQVEVDRLSCDVRERDDILENQRMQFINEKNELEQQIKIIFEKMSQQRQRIQELDDQNYQQQCQIQKLTIERDKLDKDLKSLTSTTNEQIRKQKEQIDNCNKLIEENQLTILQNEEQIQNNETQIAELQNQLEEQYAQNQKLTKDVNELNDELEETRQDREAKIQEMDQWKRQFKQNNVPLSDYDQVKKEAELYKNKSMDQEQLINKLETQQQANNKEIYHLQGELSQYKSNLQETQSQLVNKKKENDNMSTELENLKREQQRTLNQLKEIEQRDQQNSELVIKQKKEIQRLNDDLETKNRQLGNMEQQLNKKFDEVATKQRELEELKRKFQQDAFGKMTTSPSQKSVMMASQNMAARSTAKGLTTKISEQQN
ncbi:unnamed protein product [Paramecium primaurelia]|uniref:Uncharacterized protein n=1 Tax=Paramecium primaurelia TaxID=5886 RepID=A0A8S1M0Y3_PARPR|nr:unnamed protein product [Paramecium primaurelia]